MPFWFSLSVAVSYYTYLFGSTFLDPFCPVMRLSISLMMDGCSMGIVPELLMSSRFLTIACFRK